MALIVLDTMCINHRKHARAGAEACWLWAMAIGWCKLHLSDGRVPAEVLPALGTFRTPVTKLAARLVAVGLFEQADDDYLIHDYHDRNQTSAEVRRKRAEKTDRQDRWRTRRTSDEPVDAPVDASTSASQSRSDRVSRARAYAVYGETEVRSTEIGSREGSGEGAAVRLHPPQQKGVALAGVVNLPAFLLHEFVRKSGKADQAEGRRYVEDWFGRVNDEWQAKVDAGAVIGDDDVTFWRARWAEAHGTTRQRMRDADVKRKQDEFGAYVERLRRTAEASGGPKT